MKPNARKHYEQYSVQKPPHISPTDVCHMIMSNTLWVYPLFGYLFQAPKFSADQLSCECNDTCVLSLSQKFWSAVNLGHGWQLPEILQSLLCLGLKSTKLQMPYFLSSRMRCVDRRRSLTQNYQIMMLIKVFCVLNGSNLLCIQVVLTISLSRTFQPSK